MSTTFRRLRLSPSIPSSSSTITTTTSSSPSTTMFQFFSSHQYSSSIFPKKINSYSSNSLCSSGSTFFCSSSYLFSSRRCCSSSSSSSTTSAAQQQQQSSTKSFKNIKIPWNSEFSKISTETFTEPEWEKFGHEILNIAKGCDAGPVAFDEALVAREQLETMLDGAGYANKLNVAVFGSAVVNGLLELGGDVDFVAVCDHEPSHEESSTAVINIAKELRRLGLRSTAVPRARVPLVKTDRVSSALPGSPVHPIAHSAVFRYVRPATPSEQTSLENILREQYGATRIEWNGSSTLVATFPTTNDTVRALAWTKRCGDLDIPLRLPVDPKHGPELFRYTFDLCLSSSGLQNSHLFRQYLSYYPFSRHLLLFLKRWARACGMINTHDGMLASYAVNVMFIHFLVRMGVIPPLQLADARDPQALPKVPEYRELENPSSSVDVATIGFLAAHYLDYYSNVFKYDSQVVCTTTKRELNKSVLRWGSQTTTTATKTTSSASGNNNDTEEKEQQQQIPPVSVTPTPIKPPFFTFCIKDPYNTENIARNISPGNTKKIQSLHAVALQILLRDGAKDPRFVAEALIDSNGPAVAALKKKSSSSSSQTATTTKSNTNISHEDNNTNVDQQQQDQDDDGDNLLAALSPEAEARREITKMAHENRKESLNRVGEATMRSHEQTRAAQDLTRSIVNWMRSAENQK